MSAPRFFATPAAFRAWLDAHHDRAPELLVGFHKKGSGKPSMTWPESVDEALCYGWIDGVRRSLDEDSYTIRFTPRRPGSIWSNVNVAKVAALLQAGRMMPAGLAAWERRDPEKSGIYVFERNHPVAFDAEMERRFKRSRRAWTFFQAQPPGYRKQATHYVTSAKRPETRERRLTTLIECSARGERLPYTVSPRKR
ncbi:MAG: bacteriocin-protection protein [Gemmatimonadaceae bacterium]|nr:bacteriocin-protection protein [Gemmatimonadaceae bacterium]NUO95454.1 bacteriocin-protection protein [Gemmatimonadaceae bacterium]NUP54684.1 bacteriocin-protection protein [Gemmatimonadaceae bacterium]NUP70438.1 bacteriocin-protection protein [Gemmatimonadaceae bacterium]NUR34778.1 bacteriocin-protection protein [Gemmatimonadaceae bacterium]